MTRTLIRFAGTKNQVLASLVAVGATVDPAHVHNTGAGVKTAWFHNLRTVPGPGKANIRADFWITPDVVRNTGTEAVPVGLSRGPHVDMLIRGDKSPDVIQKYVDALILVGEQGWPSTAELIAKYPAAAGKKYKPLTGGASLLYHTSLGGIPSAITTPLDAPVHTFA